MQAPEIEIKIPDTSHFINTQEFNKLLKKRFNAQMKGVKKASQVKLK